MPYGAGFTTGNYQIPTNLGVSPIATGNYGSNGFNSGAQWSAALGLLGGFGSWASQGGNPFQSPAEQNILGMQNPWANITNVGSLAQYGYQPLNPTMLSQALNATYANQVAGATGGVVQRGMASGITGTPLEAQVSQARTPLDVARQGKELDVLQMADQSNFNAMQMVMNAIQQSTNFKLMQSKAMSQNSPFQNMLGLFQAGLQIAPFL